MGYQRTKLFKHTGNHNVQLFVHHPQRVNSRIVIPTILLNLFVCLKTFFHFLFLLTRVPPWLATPEYLPEYQHFSKPYDTLKKSMGKKFPGFLWAPRAFIWPLEKEIILRAGLRSKGLKSERLSPD